MFKQTVLAHFDNNQSAVARALKTTRANVHKWPDAPALIPERCALLLERHTAGKLKYDGAAYDGERARKRRARWAGYEPKNSGEAA